MNPFFDWLKDTGTQAMLVLVGTSAAMIAAIAAIYYGRKSLTKKDLAQVEQNTEHLEEVRTSIASVDTRLKKQDDIDRFQIHANRVSITAMGNQSGNVPFELQLFVKDSKDPNLILTHVELYNENGNSFGSFPCLSMGNPNGLNFHADIPMATMGDWFRAGTPVQSFNRMRLKLKVWMSMGGIEVYRDMAVTVLETTSGMAGYMLNGSV
jgi:hypothetical protein